MLYGLTALRKPLHKVVPLELDQFIKSPRYRQLTLPPEDQPQDERDWKELLRADQQEQYDRYLAQFEPESLANGDSALHNTKPVLHNKPNQKWNEYMKRYNKRPIECPRCGHKFTKIKRIKQ